MFQFGLLLLILKSERIQTSYTAAQTMSGERKSKRFSGNTWDLVGFRNDSRLGSIPILFRREIF